MNRNKSISEAIRFAMHNLSDGKTIRMLGPFFKNNHNLVEISVEYCGVFTADDVRYFSLALDCCSKSLKRLTICDNRIDDHGLVDIITALSIHPQLEVLELSYSNIGRIQVEALSNLLLHTTQLKTLNLQGNYLMMKW